MKHPPTVAATARRSPGRPPGSRSAARSAPPVRVTALRLAVAQDSFVWDARVVAERMLARMGLLGLEP